MSEGRETKLALYRKYRPTKLSEVIGQPQVTDILAASAKKDSFAQSYLFTGQRGTGKTTVARILAHLINHLDYTDNINADNVDIIEIDAASNNGVDDVREIRDSVRLAPMQCPHKVYIIDEFHMLSKPAFNALLKTIEEPPEYVTFILATTELQKVPATILSRVQRFHFRPVAEDVLAKHLSKICQAEKITADDDALRLIARAGGGSVRDSITLLDQLSNTSEITKRSVVSILGLIPDEQLNELLAAVQTGATAQIIDHIRNMLSTGTSASALAEQLVRHILRSATADSGLYQLVEKLLDVRGSAIPEAKLLAVLIGYAAPSQSSAKKVSLASASATRASTTQDVTPQSIARDKSAANATTESASSKPKITAETLRRIEKLAGGSSTKTPDIATETKPDDKPIEDFKWPDLLKQVADDDHPSSRSLLEQCDYRYDKEKNILTLFFAKKFFRDRAGSASFNAALTEALKELYGTKSTIVISDKSAPSNSGVAAILSAIGGEVTKVDDGAN